MSDDIDSMTALELVAWCIQIPPRLLRYRAEQKAWEIASTQQPQREIFLGAIQHEILEAIAEDTLQHFKTWEVPQLPDSSEVEKFFFSHVGDLVRPVPYPPPNRIPKPIN